MDERVQRALERWPNVPDLYGWLRLNRRGQWLIQGGVVTNQRLFDVIGRNYTCDEHGRWFYQNGPQRGFMALDYTPFVLFAQPDGSLQTHTRLTVTLAQAAYMDEHGSLILATEHGPGVLSDQDLEWALSRLHADGDIENALGTALAQASGSITSLTMAVTDTVLPIKRCDAEQLPEVLGFVREPQAPADEAAT